MIMHQSEATQSLPKENLFQKCCELIQNKIIEQHILITTRVWMQEQLEVSFQIHNHMKAHINEVLQNSIILQQQISFILINFYSFDHLEQFYLNLNIFKVILKSYNRLKAVVLTNCNIRDEGMKVLKGIKFDYLQWLELMDNRLTNKGMMILATCTFKSLEKLNLGFNSIGNSGISYLAKAFWPALRMLLSQDAKLLLMHQGQFQGQAGQNSKPFAFKVIKKSCITHIPLKVLPNNIFLIRLYLRKMGHIFRCEIKNSKRLHRREAFGFIRKDDQLYSCYPSNKNIKK